MPCKWILKWLFQSFQNLIKEVQSWLGESLKVIQPNTKMSSESSCINVLILWKREPRNLKWLTQSPPQLLWTPVGSVTLGGRQLLSAPISTCAPGVYEGPGAAVTKYPKLGDWNNRLSLAALKVKSPKPSCQQGWFLLEVLRESLFQASLPASGGSLVPRSSDITPVSAFIFRCLLPGSSVCLSSSFKDATSHVGYQSSSDPIWPHPNTFAKTFFPGKVTFWGPGGTWIFMGHYSTW